MKIVKKLFIIVMIVLLMTGCSLIGKDKTVEEKTDIALDKIPLMQFDKYKNISLNKIKSISYIRLTEAGRQDENITDQTEIESIFNSLSSIMVGKEVTNACDDNTKIYILNMDDNSTYQIEIECNWLVIGNKRYEIK